MDSSSTSHGESGDADIKGAREALPELRRLASEYRPSDVFNVDECGLYYTAAPTKTVGPAPLPGRKKSKERVTFLMCTNSDGSERFPPLMIGKARQPRCFGGATGAQLGFDYDNGGKAWMTIAIFHRWFQRFDSYIARTPGREVILFIDNASSRGNSDNRPQLRHVRIVFLPKNTTSILQPMDQGVIASMKVPYKKKVVKRAVDLTESGVTENLYRIDLRVAATWVNTIWHKMEGEVVAKCWAKSRIV